MAVVLTTRVTRSIMCVTRRLHDYIPNTARLAADVRMWGGGMMWVRGAADVFESVGARGQVCVFWEVVGVGG